MRTAVLDFERQQEDEVVRCLYLFSESAADGLRHLLRSAAGCRWAIAQWEELQKKLTDGRHLVWRRSDLRRSSSRGFRRASTSSTYQEEAYMTWLDCLVAQPNPKQKDIDHDP